MLSPDVGSSTQASDSEYAELNRSAKEKVQKTAAESTGSVYLLQPRRVGVANADRSPTNEE